MTVSNSENIGPAQKEAIKRPTLVVVAAVNDDECLAQNLAASPMLVEKKIPLIAKRGYISATLAYNDGFDSADANIVIFAHQDVYLPQGWEQKLLSAIQLLESCGKKWGVLGVIGADARGNLVGGAWSNGLQRKIESKFSSPAPVRSFDEIVLVLRKDGGIRFDDQLPGFHLYGTDIAQVAIKAGLGAYVFDGPVVHNPVWRKTLGKSYIQAWRYLRRKWKSELPIYTLVLPITRSSWPLVRNWLRERKKWLIRQFKAMPPRVHHPDPAAKARELGYEYIELKHAGR